MEKGSTEGEIMSGMSVTPRFQKAIEPVEALPLDEQILLIGLIQHHLIQQRRNELAADIVEARDAYRRNQVRRGTVADLMEELAA